MQELTKKNRSKIMSMYLRFCALVLAFSLILPLSAQKINGSWKGSLKVGSQTLTMLLDFDAESNTAKMGVVEQGVKDLPVTVNLLTVDSVNLSIAQLGASYTGRLKNGILEGTFNQMGYAFPLNLEPGKIIQKRPQNPIEPLPYKTENIKFNGGTEGVVLAGTMTYPIGYKAEDNVPVVLMVTGSGPQDRNEELFGHQPFYVLADYLARHGIASLRYDDRGVGQSSGIFNTATTTDFASDAKAGIAYLKGLNHFSNVGILGHSEGGSIAFMLGKAQVVDFIVSLAGPAGRIDELMVAQLNGLAISQGSPGNIVNTPQEAVAFMLQADNRPWMKEFLELDMTPYLQAIKCPVLAIGGDNDLNVPPVVNTPCLENGLANNKQSTINVYAGLNHLLQHAPKGPISLAANIEETISEEVLSDIATWINSVISIKTCNNHREE